MAEKHISFVGVLLAGLAVLVVVLGYFLLIGPAWQNVAHARQEQKIAGQNLTIVQKNLETLRSIDAAYKQNKNLAASLSVFLPKGDDIPELLAQLEAMAYKEAGVGMVKVNFPKSTEPAVADAALATLPITLDVQGTYASYKNFLAALERSMRLLDVTSVAFQAKSVDPELANDVYGYRVDLIAYYIPQ